MFFTTFPHKIQLPIDCNRFYNRKSGSGENPGFPRMKIRFSSGDANSRIFPEHFQNLYCLGIPKWYVMTHSHAKNKNRSVEHCAVQLHTMHAKMAKIVLFVFTQSAIVAT